MCSATSTNEDGRVIKGNAIAANLGPKPAPSQTIDEADLPAEFRARIERLLVGSARNPIGEMLIPSTPDSSLAPKGLQFASLFCQHFAYKLPGGRDWRQEKTRAEDLIFATVESYAPNFCASIPGHSSLSPLDPEEKLGLAGGEIFHRALSLDQLWAARPVLGYGDYRTPLKSLYLYGAGAHPGGGVTGFPGHNAAREILRDGVNRVSRPNR